MRIPDDETDEARRKRERSELARRLLARRKDSTPLASLGQRVLELAKRSQAPDAPPSCVDCEATGWKALDQNGRRVVVPCPACATKIVRRDYADNIPVDWRMARLSNYQATAQNRIAREAATAWLDTLQGRAPVDLYARELARRDLLFVGGTGTGKTRLCVTLLNEAYLAGCRSALFIHAPTYIQEQLDGIRVEERTAAALALKDQCYRAEPLGVDDVAGAEAGSDYSRRELLLLCEARTKAGLHTIWTSNLHLDALAAFFSDDRLPSRWAERAQVIEVGGADRRVGRSVTPFRRTVQGS